MFLSWLTTVLGSIFIGIALTLFLQYYFGKKYFSSKVCISEENRVVNEPLLLPKIFEDLVRISNLTPSDTCMAINLLLQFLFHELRDTEKVRRWFRNKLSLEFQQLLGSSIVGRMIANIRIREIHLGSEFPVLTNVGVQDLKVNYEYSHIDTLDLKLDISYSGKFRLVIDVDLLGKSAYVSIIVNELLGEGRLEFNRLPYSHWSFTFYNEPKLQLDVVSQFQGRAYQQIATLISNQIRRALRRKHTLPYYKIRYKPFFDVVPREVKIMNVKPGQIQLTIHRISRLNQELAKDRDIYVLAGIDSLPWIEIRNYGTYSFFILDIVIVKKIPTLGLQFKQNVVEEKDEVKFMNCIVLTEIKLGGFESNEELLPGDIVLSVEGKNVNSLNQLNKFLKSVPEQFTLRVERRITERKCEESCTSFTSNACNLSACPIYSLRRRKGSESESCGSTPSTSLPGSPARRIYFRNPLENSKVSSPSSHSTQQYVVHQCDDLCQNIVKTKSVTNNQIIFFDNYFCFNIKRNERYLNINVRAKESDTQSDKLVGYVNIPLCNLEAEDDYLKSLYLKRPDNSTCYSRSHKLSCQNGFKPELCYGDIVLSVKHILFSSSPTSLSIPKVPESIESELTPSENVDLLKGPMVVSATEGHDFAHKISCWTPACDVCGNKVHYKDFQMCRKCNITVHEKCISKCMSDLNCYPSSFRVEWPEGEKSPGIDKAG